MVALGDGGALLAAGSALIRLDAEGQTRGVREIGRALSLAQRDDMVVVLWRDDDSGSHVGRLDVDRLGEVGL